MKKVNITEIDKKDYFEYHIPCGNGLLEKSLFYGEHRVNTNSSEEWGQYLWDLGITSFGSEENSLLYGLIVKILSSSDTVYIIHFGNFEELEQKLTPSKIDIAYWKYSFEFTIEDNKFCRQYGYQTPIEFLNEMKYFDKDLTNRGFYMAKVNRNHINSYIKTFSSDVSSWSLILNADWDKLTALLQNVNQRPSIQEILQYADCVVNIQIGSDEGYLDYVLIQSRRQLKTQILIDRLTRFGQEYESLLQDLDNIFEDWQMSFFEEYFKELNKLSESISFEN